MSQGYVYILTHPRMEGLVKIGYTTKTPQERCDEISRDTGVPGKFEVSHSVLVTNCEEVERLVHQRLSDLRYEKEFFEIGLEESISIVDEKSVDFLTTEGKLGKRVLELEEMLKDNTSPIIQDLIEELKNKDSLLEKIKDERGRYESSLSIYKTLSVVFGVVILLLLLY